MEQELELLKRATNEIKMLRNQNQQLSARLEIYDNMINLFRAHPGYGNGIMAPDLLWEIERHISNQTKEESQGVPIPDNSN